MRYVSLLLLFLSFQSQAYTAKYEVDASAHPVVGRSPVAQANRNGNSYIVDVSAIANVDASKLLDVALDYDKYATQYRMPNLNESHVVTAQPQHNLIVMWSNMSYMSTFSSAQYMSVRYDRALPDGGMGMKWQLIPRRESWPYRSDPAFNRMDGSFYILPQADGTVYVRYYGVSDLAISLPRIVSGTILEVMKTGASQVVDILLRKAANR